MTPNGAAAFAVIMIAAAAAAGPRGLAVLYAVAALFAAVEVGTRAAVAARRAAWLMLPLAVFMLAVWVAFVGRAPQEIAAGMPGTRTAALLYVATVCARLFLVVTLLQIVVLRFDAQTPLESIRALALPLAVKRQLVLTLSLIETLRHAIDRAHLALVAGGILTRRLSLHNLTHGWVLIQTVWLAAITSVSGRMRDKWPIEHTLDLIAPALVGGEAKRIPVADMVWLAVAVGAAALTLLAGIHGAA